MSRRNSQKLKRVASFPKDPLTFYNCLKKNERKFQILKKLLKVFKGLENFDSLFGKFSLHNNIEFWGGFGRFQQSLPYEEFEH